MENAKLSVLGVHIPSIQICLALSETGNSCPGQDSETLSRGNLAPHAASVLMKLLYAARIARFDTVEIHQCIST